MSDRSIYIKWLRFDNLQPVTNVWININLYLFHFSVVCGDIQNDANKMCVLLIKSKI